MFWCTMPINCYRWEKLVSHCKNTAFYWLFWWTTCIIYPCVWVRKGCKYKVEVHSDHLNTKHLKSKHSHFLTLSMSGIKIVKIAFFPFKNCYNTVGLSECSNTEQIQNPNVLKFCFWMVKKFGFQMVGIDLHEMAAI